jgi:KaiC domain protein
MIDSSFVMKMRYRRWLDNDIVRLSTVHQRMLQKGRKDTILVKKLTNEELLKMSNYDDDAVTHFIRPYLKSSDSSLRWASIMAIGHFEEFEDNLILIDAASSTRLRENLPDLLATLAYVIQHYKVKFTIIDSVTGLFETKEMLARSIVRRLFNFMKKWYQTALFVSQKRSGHEELTAEAAGGYAIGHIVDGTMVLAKEIIDSSYKAKIYKKELGEIIRLFRIDGCRMCGHDTKTHFLEITEEGLVVIKEPISKTK